MLRWVGRGFLVLLVAGLLGAGVASWRFANLHPADPAVAPDPRALAYFIDDYAPARQAFLAQGEALARRFDGVERFAEPVAAADGAQGLFVDGLYVPAQRTPRRLLVLTSGVHGVEGAVGGAVMRMFMDEFMTDTLLADTGVLMLHALNPYGFARQRRVTAHNVDLNRNASLNTTLYQTQNAGYPIVDPLINPRTPADPDSWADRLFLLRAVALIAQHGLPVLRQAVLQGQYSEPRGIYYGGNALEPQLAALAPRLSAVLERYPLSMGIDLHTGYGTRGRLHVFLNPPESPNLREGLEAVFSGQPIDWGNHPNFYTVTGDVASWIGALRKSGAHLPAVFEFGTMDSQTTLGAVKSLHIGVLENQGAQHGWASDAAQARIQRDYREMFNPSSPAWRTKVIRDSRSMLGHVLTRLPEVTVHP